ncbi:GntR family transcriptional regulator [Pseudonocardia alni]|uniref:GntR family transcriptional regulator n=1 Tax=Pseudonocardia alni TaxID=33907 RepID=UPI00340E3CA1
MLDTLRERLLSGRYEPLTPLRLKPLADELGVSTMPVRAALARLEGEGLVQTAPRRGAVVAPIDLDSLDQVQAVRAALEGYAARLGAERITDAGIVEMREALRRVDAATTHEESVAAEWDGYSICHRASGQQRLIDLVGDHRRMALRYIRLVMRRNPEFSVAAHSNLDRLIEACDRRDGETAERVLREAMAWTGQEVRALLQGTDGSVPRTTVGKDVG